MLPTFQNSNNPLRAQTTGHSFHNNIKCQPAFSLTPTPQIPDANNNTFL